MSESKPPHETSHIFTLPNRRQKKIDFVSPVISCLVLTFTSTLACNICQLDCIQSQNSIILITFTAPNTILCVLFKSFLASSYDNQYLLAPGLPPLFSSTFWPFLFPSFYIPKTSTMSI